jgi:4-hydroxy-3-methylbut-2-enyl diphosphate reductase
MSELSDKPGKPDEANGPQGPGGLPAVPSTFRSELIERIRAAGDVWRLSGGEILLPRAFGFCRGVERALEMLEQAVARHGEGGKQILLLGQIIHNPWVNDYFRRRGVRILTPTEMQRLEDFVRPSDCAVVPAFGVPLPIEDRLRRIGCEIVNTSCGDVRRLWVWAEQAAGRGFGILIFGRASHDETVVTKSRLAAAGGKYLVAGNLAQVEEFCRQLGGPRAATGGKSPVAVDLPQAEKFCRQLGDPRAAEGFREAFDGDSTNADGLAPFERLAQVSQTTMLYDDTMKVRELIRAAFERRFGAAELGSRLLFQPTVCRATQDRQAAAVELCRKGLDLVVVVGGFESSNTRHLYELACGCAPAAYFIEDAQAILSLGELRTMDFAAGAAAVVRDWLPGRRSLRIGVLAGASCPEIVVGEVLQRLATFLAGA